MKPGVVFKAKADIRPRETEAFQEQRSPYKKLSFGSDWSLAALLQALHMCLNISALKMRVH